jgi:hypothetical protein
MIILEPLQWSLTAPCISSVDTRRCTKSTMRRSTVGSTTSLQRLSNGSIIAVITTADAKFNADEDQVCAAADSDSLITINSHQMAYVFALESSRVLLRTVAEALQQPPALVTRHRITLSLSRIPTAPLYLTMSSIFLLVAFGIVLTVMALIAARIKSAKEDCM